jgi:hypothetical protein
MTRCLKLSRWFFPLAFVSACAPDVNAPTLATPMQPLLASAVPVPIEARCTVRYTLDNSVTNQLAMDGTGTCQMSHLGRTSIQVTQTADLNQGRVTGSVTFTAANGDKLRAQVSAPFASGDQVTKLQGSITFAGGTGKFATAHGTATFTSDGKTALNVAINYAGSIQYGKGESGIGVTPDAARAVTRTVDIEGGTLTARSSSGIDYELVIPRGALGSPVAITMTPIASAQNFPTSGGFAAGVDFAPAGLRFAQAAKLRITLPNRPSGLQLIVTGYDADPAAMLPLLPADNGTVIEVPVAHFSGVAAGFGTSADLLAMPIPAPTTQSSHHIAQLAVVAGSALTPAEKLAANTQIMVAWLQNIVQPLFASTTTDLQLLLAMSEFDLWSNHAEALGLTAVLDADITNTKDMAALDLLAAIDGNADRCGAQQSLAALYNVGFWYLQAVYIGVAQPHHFLDDYSVSETISSRCLTVELASDTLASPMIVGTPYTISLVYGIRFKGQTTLQAVPLHVGLAPVVPSLTIAPGIGATDAAGLFQSVITAHSAGDVLILAYACLPLPGLTPPPTTPYNCSDVFVGHAGVLSPRTAEDRIQVAVTPSSLTLGAGATAQFTAQVAGTSNQNVNWTATGGTISSAGVFTAGNVAGTFSVTATSVADPNAVDVVTVTISSSVGVNRLRSIGAVNAVVLSVSQASGVCNPIFSPPAATTWSASVDCTGTQTGGGVAAASFSTSFTETHVGGRLVAVTASGNGTASASPGDIPTGAGGGTNYHLEFEVLQTVDVSFDASLTTTNGFFSMVKRGQPLPIVHGVGNSSANQTFTLTPGIWEVHITASNQVPQDPAVTSFRLDMRFQ